MRRSSSRSYSLEKHRELGLRLVEPVVIGNAVDPDDLPSASRTRRRSRVGGCGSSRRAGRTTRERAQRRSLGSTGTSTIARYELTFVGRTTRAFDNVAVVGPVDSQEVARLLRAHDVYVAASRDDPCSNALLEALACGLPAVFRDERRSPGARRRRRGVRSTPTTRFPSALDRLVAELDRRRSDISVPSIAEVADRYLDVLGLASDSP